MLTDNSPNPIPLPRGPIGGETIVKAGRYLITKTLVEITSISKAVPTSQITRRSNSSTAS